MPRADHKLLLLAETKMRLGLLGLLVAGVICVYLVIEDGRAQQAEPQLIDAGSLPFHLSPAQEQRLRGQELFAAHCSACHKLDRHFTGPALKGVLDRAPVPAHVWLRAFLTREDSLIAAEEPYTLTMRKEWKASPWTHDKAQLKPEELEILIKWVESPVY